MNAVFSLLVLGGAAGCLFETEFLAYARCETADECGPVWGEQRHAIGCFVPQRGDGFCTPRCQQDSDCPSGEGDAASHGCRELAVRSGGGTVNVCALTCDQGSCADGMMCQQDAVTAAKVCVFDDR